MSTQALSENSSSVSWSRPRCKCGLLAPLRVALTQANTGRRFHGCANYERGRGCGFFRWFDPPTPAHLKALLYATLQEKEDYKLKYETYVDERGDVHRGLGLGAWLGHTKMWIAIAAAFGLYAMFG